MIHHINKLKNKSHVIISIVAEKAFRQNSTPIYDKNSPESGHRGNLPQHSKEHIWQTHNKHHSQCWKTEIISSKIRNKTRMSTFTTIIQHSFGSPGHGNQRRKRNKRMDLESVIQSEVNQKEKNKYCMWSLEKWYRWSYLQSRNRDTDVENKCILWIPRGKVGVGGTGRLALTYICYWYYV